MTKERRVKGKKGKVWPRSLKEGNTMVKEIQLRRVQVWPEKVYDGQFNVNWFGLFVFL